jgi:hypothetical protein
MCTLVLWQRCYSRLDSLKGSPARSMASTTLARDIRARIDSFVADPSNSPWPPGIAPRQALV